MLKPRITLKQLAWSTAFLLALSAMLLVWSAVRQQESTLAIRAVHQGPACRTVSRSGITSTLTAFVLKALHQRMTLCLSLSIPAPRVPPPKAVLDKTLPHGYIIAQQDDSNQAVQWLSRLRDTPHRVG